MKILMINNYHYRRGGADVVYFNTASILQQNGHKVSFFSIEHPNNEPCDFSDFFVKEHDYRKLSLINKILSVPSFIYSREAYKKLTDLISKEKPDIVHIHLFLGGLTTSILLALKKINIPVVHTLHDYRLICPAYTLLDRNDQICERCKDKFYLRCAIRRCSLEKNFIHSSMLAIDAYFRKYIFNPIKYIDRFIFVSQFSKNKHIEFDSKFKQKAEVLYNFNINEIPTSNVKGKYFLFYGRLSREKGLDLLIKSALETNISLKIVGTGPLYNQFVNNFNTSNIEFLGYKKGAELFNIIRESSFVIIPSQWYENNPLTIIEAFSFGKPVIGSKIGGIPELINDSNGFLFESKNVDSLTDAIKKAISISDDNYRIMSQNVFEFANRNFSKEVYYNKLLSIYKSVINDKKNN